MFFSTDILRRGRTPLGRIWSAAFSKNLRRRNVQAINVEASCDAVLDPAVPQALRLQAILTTGIVKVHEKKVTYLHQDAEGALHRLHYIADTSDAGQVKKGTKRRRNRITREPRQPSEQAPDIARGLDAFDGEYFTGQGLQSLEDDDYFVVQFHDGTHGSDYGNGYDLEDGYDYMMESPPEFLPDLEEAIIPRVKQGSPERGHGYDDYGHDDYGPAEARHVKSGVDLNPMGPLTIREPIVIRPRKRRRPIHVDEELVDPDMLFMNASRQEQDHLLRRSFETRTPEARECRLASFPVPLLDACGCPAAHSEALDDSALLDVLGGMLVHRNKTPRSNGRQVALGVANDWNGVDDHEDRQAERHPHEDLGQDFYDGDDTERGVELEQLRTALHLTPQNQNPFGFGPGAYSSNPTSSLAGSVRSSVDLSREDSGLANSVQKEKLSDLLLESQYELQNDNGPDSGRRRSGRSGRSSRGWDVTTWSQLERFRLQETGPSDPQEQVDFFVAHRAGSTSHTLDILTKARLCCRNLGAIAEDPSLKEDDGNYLGVNSNNCMSLDEITRHLSRQEAAKMFHHVLVGVTTGIVTASQPRPYAPILIEFDSLIPPPARTSPPRKTVSVAIGASCVENAVSHELGSMLAGQLARAAAIFNVDEVVVVDDGPKHGEKEVSRAAALLAKILQYQETPQYLRKALIPMHELYRYCGMLAPLDAPHHLRATEWFEYREGVVTGEESDQSLCDIGLDIQALVVGSSIPQNTRVTLHVGKARETVVENGREYIKASIANPLDVKRTTGRYWGYDVRIARSVKEMFQGPFGGYDLTIGTSERGEINECCSLSLPSYRHALVVIGGPNGLEYLLQNDPSSSQYDSPSTLFDRYLNVCPNQGSRTIRTEEAVLLCLMYLRPALGI